MSYSYTSSDTHRSYFMHRSDLFWHVYCHCRQAIYTHHQIYIEIIFYAQIRHLFWPVYCHCRQAIHTHHQINTEHHILCTDQTYLFWHIDCHCRLAIYTHHQIYTEHHIFCKDQLPTYSVLFIPAIDESFIHIIRYTQNIIFSTQTSYLPILTCLFPL